MSAKRVTIYEMTEREVDELMSSVDGLIAQHHLRLRAQSEGMHYAARVQSDGWNVFEGRLLACGGVSVLWYGVGEAWLQTTPLAHYYPKSLYAGIRDYLLSATKHMNLHRVQCAVRENDMKGHRLMLHLGWRDEGCLEQFGPDRMDYELYACVARKEPHESGVDSAHRPDRQGHLTADHEGDP